MSTPSSLTGTVAVDASWCPKVRVGAFAILIHMDHKAPILKSGIIYANMNSAQFAEEWAIHKGIMEAKQLGFTKITIHSVCLSAILKLRRETVRDLSFVRYEHVKAHSKEIDIFSSMNRWCDREARRILRVSRMKLACGAFQPSKARRASRSRRSQIWYPGCRVLQNHVA